MVAIQVVKPSNIESTTMSKVTWRLVPFLMLCYFIAYLDRVNIGFAGATMSADLNLSATAFGGAAGIFFLAYFFFEVPSNLALNAFGARRWIARIMFTWGIISGAQAFVSGDLSFNIVRLLLGVAEAGFFPGIIFFLTLWFPTAYRARIVGWFMFAIPISTVIGAPISGLILGLEGVAGLHGWQWMFLIEGFPALIMTFAVLYYLTDRPIDANWLPSQVGSFVRLNRVSPSQRKPVSTAAVAKPESKSIAAVFVIDFRWPEYFSFEGRGPRSPIPARICNHRAGLSLRKRALSDPDFSFGIARIKRIF